MVPCSLRFWLYSSVGLCQTVKAQTTTLSHLCLPSPLHIHEMPLLSVHWCSLLYQHQCLDHPHHHSFHHHHCHSLCFHHQFSIITAAISTSSRPPISSTISESDSWNTTGLSSVNDPSTSLSSLSRILSLPYRPKRFCPFQIFL